MELNLKLPNIAFTTNESDLTLLKRSFLNNFFSKLVNIKI